ncbi:tRNA (adenosine(37)-N6)-threonylcarbamoyltransferase complex dimerization subunit type 1 TsaB [Actinophytocola xanthii]|uniref:tRNA (Adenosine(37)-N6)-threonylcarbamoyltransferase complex dimerization subunit type 1 TsaB n=1 Tax=Actinophytocola xanthii TaxID=1912961 RepID=A0A1Q8CDR9_9PSEU|nr:tRNA (adenosine(37)-N6)-threonylcarbamoyltransferase complex dimerization subunit type 1 TsaB [Actinophytocola xanthii]OLF12482.1 tRNA (adenosine(37)-N6)-threonylcarbamoyltransferase complex dimerization subunit type 1 TsaB [Actinophytocola xanthii]
MLVLAVDTATPAVTAGVVLVGGAGPEVLAQRVTVDARAHGELLTPHVLAALADAGRSLADVAAIVCGVGPGPFTGLRAGIATAAALGHALDVPTHPVCSLDAIAAGTDEPLLVTTDARRRELYWATYEGGVRTAGPGVDRPADVAAQLAGGRRRAGTSLYADLLAVEHTGAEYPTPAGLVAAAGDALAGPGEPLVPLYLRRPDATVPGSRKRVTAP